MNYYKRHIGDYMKDASHLSLLEHGVYMRLLDVYYTRESAIPVDQAARLISARSRDEREALSVVAGEFFTVVDGFYKQTRCDFEISSMQQKAETNREVGKRGGRPKKVTPMVPEYADYGNPEITQMVSEFNPDVTLATNHKPLTNNQTHTAAVDQPPGEPDGSVCVQVCKAMRDAGIGDTNPSDAGLAVLVGKGADVGMFAAAAPMAVKNGKGFAYALGIVKAQMLAAASMADAPMAVPAVRFGQTDVSRVTVPASAAADAALRHIEADAAIPRSGPPAELVERLAKRRGAVAAGAGA